MSPPEVLGQVDGRGVMWLNLPAPGYRLVDRREAGHQRRARHWAAPAQSSPVAAREALRGHDRCVLWADLRRAASLTATTIPQTVITRTVVAGPPRTDAR